MVYMRHRRFLIKKHRYRATTMNKYFDNQDEPETDEPKRTRYGQKVFDMVKGISMSLERRRKRKMGPRQGRESKIRWRNQLSYWKELDTPHAIDCKHLEKNVFESTIGILLDIRTKMKDGLKSQMDLVNQDIRTEIHPHRRHRAGKSTFQA